MLRAASIKQGGRSLHMPIHVVYATPEGRSRMKPVTMAGGLSYLDPPCPALGWRTVIWEGPAFTDSFHTAKGFGSLQTILEGRLTITVTDGDLRRVTGGPGDAFVFVDTTGDGHEASRPDDATLCAINIRFADDWAALTETFDGWPEEAVPFA